MDNIQPNCETADFRIYDLTRGGLHLAVRKRADNGHSQRYRIASDMKELFGTNRRVQKFMDVLVSSDESRDTRYGFLWNPSTGNCVMRLSNIPSDYVECLRRDIRLPQNLEGCSLRHSNALRDIRSYFSPNSIYTTNAMMRDLSMGKPHTIEIYEYTSWAMAHGMTTAASQPRRTLTDEQMVRNHRQTHLYRKVMLENDGWSTADECRIFVGFNPFVTGWQEIEGYCDNLCL